MAESVRDVWLRSGLDADEIERLAEADAFRSLGIDRRAALWAVRALDGKARPKRFRCSSGPEAGFAIWSRKRSCRECRPANMSSTTIARSACR